MKKRRVWTWMPAAVFLVASIATAAGITVISSAGAASSTTVNVVANVGSQVDVTPTCDDDGGTAGNQQTLAALTANAGANPSWTGSDCLMSMSTNDPEGIDLNVVDANADALPAFCRIDGGTNAGDSRADDCVVADDHMDDVTAGAALGNDEFGIALRAVNTGTDTAVADWTVNDTAGAPTAAGAWYPSADAADLACHYAGPTADAECAFRFGADPGGTQTAGNYEANITFSVTAR